MSTKQNLSLSNNDVLYLKTELSLLVDDILEGKPGIRDKALVIKLELQKRFDVFNISALEQAFEICFNIDSKDLYTRRRNIDIMAYRNCFMYLLYKLEVCDIDQIQEKFNLEKRYIEQKLKKHPERLIYHKDYKKYYNQMLNFLNISDGLLEAKKT